MDEMKEEEQGLIFETRKEICGWINAYPNSSSATPHHCLYMYGTIIKQSIIIIIIWGGGRGGCFYRA